MRAFEYVKSQQHEGKRSALLGATWGQTEILAGGTDLLALDEG